MVPISRFLKSWRSAGRSEKKRLMAFFDEVFVPFRDFNYQIFLAIGDALAGKPRFQA
jgi:hypothetical protein